jgi:uncharacterized protein with PIN domain
MILCPHCDGRLTRVHREPLEKIRYSDMYVCLHCKRRMGSIHKALFLYTRFLFSRTSRCLRCGQEDIQRLEKPDKIDRFSTHPLALVQKLFGAPIHRCVPCRLQFYDWRRPRRRSSGVRTTAGQSTS